MKLQEIEKKYEKDCKANPGVYASFEDYLGANALTICENCDEVVEYDEVDESGYCLEKCSDEE